MYHGFGGEYFVNAVRSVDLRGEGCPMCEKGVLILDIPTILGPTVKCHGCRVLLPRFTPATVQIDAIGRILNVVEYHWKEKESVIEVKSETKIKDSFSPFAWDLTHSELVWRAHHGEEAWPA